LSNFALLNQLLAYKFQVSFTAPLLVLLTIGFIIKDKKIKNISIIHNVALKVLKFLFGSGVQTLLTTGLGPPNKQIHRILRVTDMFPSDLPPCKTTQ